MQSAGTGAVPFIHRYAPVVRRMGGPSNANGSGCAIHPVNRGVSASIRSGRT